MVAGCVAGFDLAAGGGAGRRFDRADEDCLLFCCLGFGDDLRLRPPNPPPPLRGMISAKDG